MRLGKNGTLDDVSPFLTTVIYATAARTFGGISQRSIRRLRALSLHHVGQVFASPSVYPLVDSLYALLVLILWPLDAADDVALLVHGAKRLANTGDRGLARIPNGVSHLDYCSHHDNGNRDHVRLVRVVLSINGFTPHQRLVVCYLRKRDHVNKFQYSHQCC